MDSEEKLERAARLKSAALRLIERRGEWKPVGVAGSTVKVKGFESGTLLMLYTTPFQNLPQQLSD